MSISNYPKSTTVNSIKDSPPSSPSLKKPKLEQDGKSLSPIKESITAFDTRTNAGSTVVTFGPLNSSLVSEKYSKSVTLGTVATVVNVDPRFGPGSKVRFMMESLDAKVLSLNQRILDFSDELQDADPETFGGLSSQSVSDPVQDPVWVSGLIVPDADFPHLASDALVLQGSREASQGARVKLNLSSVPSFRVFPGQAVAAYGTNPMGRCFYAQKLITSLPLLPRLDPKLHNSSGDNSDKNYNNSSDNNNNSSKCNGAKIVVATGPFALATRDSLFSFEPLQALLKHCGGGGFRSGVGGRSGSSVDSSPNPFASSSSPDLVVLIGPFLDLNHPAVGTGLVDMAFERIMEAQVTRRLEDWLKTHPNTAVALVPGGSRDVASLPLFPTPPELLGVGGGRGGGGGKREGEVSSRPSSLAHNATSQNSLVSYTVPTGRLTVVPNPCLLRLESGATLSLMATDVLTALGAAEFASKNHSVAQRISALACHLIQQRSFYPVFPAPPGTCLDTTFLGAADMREVADVMVLASDMAPFVKPVMWGNQLLENASGSGKGKEETDAEVKSESKENSTTQEGGGGGHAKPGMTPTLKQEEGGEREARGGGDKAGNKAVSVAVNPGRVAVGTSGGTFARITVNPGVGAAFERTEVAVVRI